MILEGIKVILVTAMEGIYKYYIYIYESNCKVCAELN